jgi:diguanylate cyclase (GGDEF)-like protein
MERRQTWQRARILVRLMAIYAVFQAVALSILAPESAVFIVGVRSGVVAIAAVADIALPNAWRRHPSVAIYAASLTVVSVAAVTAVGVPKVVLFPAGYVVMWPIIVALLVPWRVAEHIRWLLAYGALTVGFVLLGPLTALGRGDRNALTVALLVAMAASFAGHLVLNHLRISSFAQLQRVRDLRKRADDQHVELERVHGLLEITARTDDLTGAGNRRRLLEDLGTMRGHIQRTGESWGLLEFDLDRFKAVNDREGHPAGDAVLRAIADGVRAELRSADAMYRYGGEEFVLLLPAVGLDGAAAAAERIRAAVEALDIPHPGNPPFGRVTISVGATVLAPAPQPESDDVAFARVDAALFRAKAAGRNRVELVEPR